MIIKRGFTLAVIGFAIFFFPSEEWGADWMVHLTTGNFTYHYDQDNIEEVSSGILRIWQKWFPSAKKVKEMVQEDGPRYANWDHSLLLTDLDCQEGRQRLLIIVEYDRSGNVTYTEDYSDSCWIPIISGSVGEALFKVMCQRDEAYEKDSHTRRDSGTRPFYADFNS